MKRISFVEAQERLDALLAEGAQGEVVVVEGADGALYRLRVERVTETADPRSPDLHAGLVHMADDFDAELPDSFWLDGAGG